MTDSESSEPAQKASEAIHPKDSTNPDRQLTPGEPQVTSHIIPPPTNPPETNQGADGRTPPRKHPLEKAAVLIALGLLVVNTMQMCASKKSADTAQLALAAADRPWIGVKTVQIHLAEGQAARFNVLFTNFGKSPAIRLLINMGYNFGSPPQKGIKYRFKPLHPGDEPSVSTLMPGQDTSIPESVDESLIPTSEQMQSFNSGKTRFYFFGEAQYFDWLGRIHYTHFCAIYSPNNTPQVCREYNDAD